MEDSKLHMGAWLSKHNKHIRFNHFLRAPFLEHWCSLEGQIYALCLDMKVHDQTEGSDHLISKDFVMRGVNERKFKYFCTPKNNLFTEMLLGKLLSFFSIKMFKLYHPLIFVTCKLIYKYLRYFCNSSKSD